MRQSLTWNSWLVFYKARQFKSDCQVGSNSCLRRRSVKKREIWFRDNIMWVGRWNLDKVSNKSQKPSFLKFSHANKPILCWLPFEKILSAKRTYVYNNRDHAAKLYFYEYYAQQQSPVRLGFRVFAGTWCSGFACKWSRGRGEGWEANYDNHNDHHQPVASWSLRKWQAPRFFYRHWVIYILIMINPIFLIWSHSVKSVRQSL